VADSTGQTLRETPRPAEEWTRMLRQIAALIGVPKIEKGLCEIFPPDNAERKRFGNILRAPGTFNGFSGNFSEIVYESVIPRTIRLGEAPSHGKSIIEYDSSGKGAAAYRALADEFLRRRAAVQVAAA
jgi:cellulose biosynthesis protein BcsQ